MTKPATLPEIYKTKQMLEVQTKYGGEDIRPLLVRLHNQLGSQTALANELGVTQPTIDQWFSTLGIVVETQRIARLAEAPQPVAA